MQLWTDYEGLTIDGAFPLKRLLLPEGRSAFFSTANGEGERLVLRLIECHFDEEEILARWRCLETLNHPALLKLAHYGQIELDGAPAVYAVFEKVDANLSEALDHGHLSVKETAQIAASVLAALEILHSHGYVHEHVEARNVFAVGDTVELRSDCIREAREGEEGREAKRRDVHDAAVVLLQALTQRKTPEGLHEAELPAPFGEIVRHGMSGRWGLAEMQAALEEGTAESIRATTAPAVPAASEAAVGAAPWSAAPEPRTAPEPQVRIPQRKTERSPWGDDPIEATVWQEVAGHVREDGSLPRSRWMAPVAAVLMLVLAGLLFAHAWHTQAKAARPTQTAARRAAATEPVLPPGAGPSRTAAKHGRSEWRVIVYTYNRESTARKKVQEVAARHPELKPEVFAPSGHAPYLVAIGGIMGREQANALARRARGLDLPRDTYAQNF